MCNMTILQEQAVQMIHGMSDDNVKFLIEVIHRLIPQKTQDDGITSITSEKDKKYRLLKS